MEPAKDLILVHTLQLKPMIKAQSSGRMVSSGISDVVIASVHSEKTSLKKVMMMMKKMLMMIIIITLLVNDKGDVAMAKHFSETRMSFQLQCICNLK